MSATVWRTRDEPLAVRNGRGPLHLAVPGTTVGGNSRAGVTDRYLAACRTSRGPRILSGPKVHAIDGAHAEHLIDEPDARWCPDCDAVMDQALTREQLWEMCGW